MPDYEEIEAQNLIINEMSKEKYESITPEPLELYLTPDTTDQDIADAISTHNTSNTAHADIRTIAEKGETAYNTIQNYGNIVTHNTSEFATSTQGGLADTAVQPNDNISELNNDAGYITGITSSDVTTALGYTPYNSSNPSGYQANVIEGVQVNGTDLTPTNKKVNVQVPTNNNQLANGAGYITGIDGTDVTNALGYTPYNSTNPAGYITGITSGDVTSALGYTPYNATNPSGYITGITSADVTTALGYTPYNSTNPNNYITSSALNSYVTTNTLQTLSSGKKIFANDAVMAGNQTALLATISNKNTTTGDNAWVGRYICGAKNLTFLMGTYRTMAGIGAHSWTNAQTGAGAGWADFYLNPDGDKTVYIGGWSWIKDSGWLKVKNATNTGGKVQVNTGSITSANWKDVAYKGENVSDFSFTSISGYSAGSNQMLTHDTNGNLKWVNI